MTVSTTKVFSKWRMLWHFFASRLSIPGREKNTHLENTLCSESGGLQCHSKSAAHHADEVWGSVFNQQWIPAKITSLYVLSGSFVASFLKLSLQSKAATTKISIVHHSLLRSVWMCPLHYKWLTQQEVPQAVPTHTGMKTRPPGC